MNDRFKFRVWDKESQKFNNGMEVFDYMRGVVSPDKYVIEQCTGLKDNNGKLIYEGDILAVPYVDPIFMQPVNMEVNNNVAYVESYKGCFVAHYPERQMKYLYYYENTAEVIGNIHESKELLDDE